VEINPSTLLRVDTEPHFDPVLRTGFGAVEVSKTKWDSEKEKNGCLNKEAYWVM
jgi:hypothetical protein